ncbi:unnamed protein product [Camellia sinensis]
MIDTIGANQTIRDGETLVSAGGSFELGFFSPGSGRSRNRYLGIWYKDTATGTVVWVANRDFPLNDTSGLLKLTDQGILVLLNPTEGVSGNLVVNDGNGNNTESFLWQSFDYPSDTLLPGMKFGMNMMAGLDWYLSSWKSGDDPARGDFTYGLDPSGYPQFIIKNGAVEKMRFGPWNGLRFSGINSSVVTRLVLNPNGVIQRFVWINRTHGWIAYTTPQTDNCDFYELCGAFGSCNIDSSTMCQCLQGFEPKYPREWSNGCVRRTQLGCGVSDGFLQYSNVQLPDTQYCWFNESMTLDECRVGCLKNCSCTAYANMDIRGGGSGCFLWFGDLIGIRTYSTNGQDVYVKVAASELGRIGRRTIAIILALLAGVFLTGLSLTVYLWKKKQQQHQISKVSMRRSFNEGCTNESQKQDLELQQFDFATITYATDNFSINNKLGEGGFGPVFKGMLEDGQEIAVKTLSKNSKQGVDEFKNEVIYIAILQHRNLVKLLGYCFRGEEKMLIYEYMPNKSLDLFIFDISSSPSSSEMDSISASPTSGFDANSVFAHVVRAPEDLILGVTVAYNKDPSPIKLNLGVGAYRTEEGKPLVLNMVRKAEQILVNDSSRVKEYLPIVGLADFNKLSAKLIFGADSPAIQENRVTTVRCLSGTGSLRVGAEFLAKHYHQRTIYIPQPTWGNHPKIFTIGRLSVKTYSYYDPATRGLNFQGLLDDLSSAPSGAIVLLHACAHNPTGVDPTLEQWEQIRKLMRSKGLLPFFDSAYQGFASGSLDADAQSVRMFVADGGECLVAQSYAKNMGVYGERVGALSIFCKNADVASRVESQLKLDITQRLLLDRPKRLNIINGIARGLLYLHQDSRLRIIHRDLKASNILLDNEMNPKISGFGMAKHFGGNESEANTSRVVGTYGYMSPEHTIDGIFSIKSDVYSFGVLVLEIVSGKRNKEFSHPGHHLNRLGHAWKLCIEGRSRELVDPLVEDLENQSELVRAIHVGLLCVQQYPEDRPNMSTVVLMLGGEGELPLPKQPGFFTKRNVLPEKDFSTSTREPGSDNIVSVTVTLLEGR